MRSLILGIISIPLAGFSVSSPSIASENGRYFKTSEDYLTAYDLNFEDVAHQLEFLGNEDKVAVNLFEVQRPAGAIVLLHGLFGHAGQLVHLIGFLIDQGMAYLPEKNSPLGILASIQKL